MLPLSSSSSSSSSSTLCTFCTKRKSALLIQLPVLGRKKRAATPYCLTCYYTTSAVRQDPEKYVSVLDKKEQMKQLPAIQNLFSECFLELEQELQQESVRSFKNNKDPLAAMMSFSSSSSNKKRKSGTKKGQPPDPRKKREGDMNDGGFLRNINVPEHLKKSQEQQSEIQNQQLARMNHAATVARRASRTRTEVNNTTNTNNNISSKRRKGSGKSIWNLAMDKGRDGKLSAVAESYKTGDTHVRLDNVNCTCGSNDVKSFGNITSRNQDVRKGEIWGTDRDEVISRYQCNSCGRTWNEEE